ncbi:flagellin [Clostridiaceae bacterium Marseille-Q4143]|nr:flagellin [Clostridiaceae bacterium Marseille-Q4143]
MRIQHNIAALNSYRNLTGNNSAVSKNLEKLSSGYRINRAGDDAAGLAISEKMRAQITGLNTAQKNAQDGVSLVQTAEGALTEVHSMLNRMVELADQSANGTYDNPVDRANLQKEISSLKDEIDRIADATNFNGINLLDGSLSAKKLDLNQASTLGGQPITVKENAAVATTSDFTVGVGDGKENTLTVEYADENGKLHSVDLKYTSNTDAAANTKSIKDAIAKSELASVFDVAEAGNKFTLTSKVAGEGGAKLITIKTTDTVATAVKNGTVTEGTNATVTAEGKAAIADGDKITLNGKTYQFVKDADTEVADGATAVLIGKADADTMVNLNKALESAGIKATLDATNITFAALNNGKGLTLQIGDTSEDFNQMTVSVGDMHTVALGIADIDISTQAGAKASVDKIKSAINSVSSTRGDLGAIQNRLEHTINNLSVTAENMTAAESRIRDVDMANEMMAYTKNNILVQSSQAMLAQANQIPQGVLQLLQ